MPTEHPSSSELIVTYLDRPNAFALSRLADKDLAADVVQEAVTKALKSADNLRDTEKLLPWLYAILRNTIADLARRQGKETASGAAVEHLADLNQEMEDEVCRCFKPLVATLPSDYGDIIRKIDLEDLSRERVAQELGITVSNLNVKVHRAREKLKEAIKSSCHMCAKHGCLNCTCSHEPGHPYRPRHPEHPTMPIKSTLCSFRYQPKAAS